MYFFDLSYRKLNSVANVIAFQTQFIYYLQNLYIFKILLLYYQMSRIILNTYNCFNSEFNYSVGVIYILKLKLIENITV